MHPRIRQHATATKRLKDYIMDVGRYDGGWPLDGVVEPQPGDPSFFPALILQEEGEKTASADKEKSGSHLVHIRPESPPHTHTLFD